MKRAYFDICCADCLTLLKEKAYRWNSDELSVSMGTMSCFVCPKCKGYTSIFIDHEMYPIIHALNKRGYATTACCQGHIYFDKDKRIVVLTSYILFADIFPEVYTTPFPEGWELISSWFIDEGADKPRNMLGLYYSSMEFSHKYPNYQLLEKWAKSLPNKN